MKFWKVSPDRTALIYVGENFSGKYEIDLTELDPLEALDWIQHMDEKEWVPPEGIAELSVFLANRMLSISRRQP